MLKNKEKAYWILHEDSSQIFWKNPFSLLEGGFFTWHFSLCSIIFKTLVSLGWFGALDNLLLVLKGGPVRTEQWLWTLQILPLPQDFSFSLHFSFYSFCTPPRTGWEAWVTTALKRHLKPMSRDISWLGDGLDPGTSLVRSISSWNCFKIEFSLSLPSTVYMLVVWWGYDSHGEIFVTCVPSLYMGKWKSLSRVRLFATPWTMQSMEFSRPEYWSG